MTQAAPVPGPAVPRARVSQRRSTTTTGGEDDVSAMLDGLFSDGTVVAPEAGEERESLADDLSLER